MKTMTEVEVDVDLDSPVVCESDEGCDRIAKWRLQALHAGSGVCVTLVLCDKCMVETATAIVRAYVRHETLYCWKHRCEVGVNWTEL